MHRLVSVCLMYAWQVRLWLRIHGKCFERWRLHLPQTCIVRLAKNRETNPSYHTCTADCASFTAPGADSEELENVKGVVAHGLLRGVAKAAIIARKEGPQVLEF